MGATARAPLLPSKSQDRLRLFAEGRAGPLPWPGCHGKCSLTTKRSGDSEASSVMNGNPVYVFWSTGTGKEQRAVTNWQHDLRKLFKDAGITSGGNMVSHRLRDTFAVDLPGEGRSRWRKCPSCWGMKASRPRSATTAKWVQGTAGPAGQSCCGDIGLRSVSPLKA